ncbi:hypothetical protein DSO57_1010882 [Entomophthora muscae]|uniref:Uncharacterized protein n=1 Tax=Entomophthora muscae TaxID=34485 RepID=A0ACC2SJK3_9FUNG|nr:hypothetical protein DSO57_1010882 [Entomophthora muscae]
MPLKPNTKAAPKASKALKSNITPSKAKTTPKKQPAKDKAPPKKPTPSSEPEETSLIPPHSHFVYSPSDPQEKLFNFNCHYGPTSVPENEEEQSCVWLQGTTSWRTQQEIFITKDLG